MPKNISKALRAAYSDPQQQQAWLEPLRQALWEGQVEEVIQACQTLASRCPEAERNANYFTVNAERMRYGRFRQMGLMIGGGVIESGCKQIITQRLKLPGTQWLEPGALYTAKACAPAMAAPLQQTCPPAFGRLTTFACTRLG